MKEQGRQCRTDNKEDAPSDSSEDEDEDLAVEQVYKVQLFSTPCRILVLLVSKFCKVVSDERLYILCSRVECFSIFHDKFTIPLTAISV